MGKKGRGVFPAMEVCFFVSLFFMSAFSGTASFQQPADKSILKTYIVHVNQPAGEVSSSKASEDLESWYSSFLPAGTESTDGQRRLVYSYRHVIRGFAARLTEKEVQAMGKKEGFVSATPEKMYHLHTTDTPAFLGLHNASGLWKESNLGQGVIIGVLDTGVHPQHPSFSDDRMLPPPAKWKGRCEFVGTVCNKKLIGARNFVSDTQGEPPTDGVGHGTHTASTAAGNFVKNVNLYDIVKGTAAGVAPRAHLAIYRVCTIFGCSGSDILAAFDGAIEDGVDIISLSVGGGSIPFHSDPIALGAYAANRKGILVSASGGNDGPTQNTVTNEAPWILTVAASSHYRKLTATAVLGNKQECDGETLYQPRNFSSKQLPLVHFGKNESSAHCRSGSLREVDVKGKVVVCNIGGGEDRVSKGAEVKAAGGAAFFLVNSIHDGYSIILDHHVLPATHLSHAAGEKIKAYIKSNRNPTATIVFKGEMIGDTSAPEVAAFSSRGPSYTTPGILKPDITGPGVNVLAAVSETTFGLESGTSMSCPHLSGVTALIKSAHPKWSPSAIKSAILTTADTLNLKKEPIMDENHLPADHFAFGAGHVNPTKASDPGLVYDNDPSDYIPYLCGLGYSDDEVGAIVSDKVNCSLVTKIAEAELNYPSFSILLGSETLKFKRVVTNVGRPNSTYTALINPPEGVEIAVKPSKIHFARINDKESFTVTIKKKAASSQKGYGHGFLKWVSIRHSVTSPISITFV